MVFSGGFHGTPPLCTNGSAGYLMQLSFKPTKKLTQELLDQSILGLFAHIEQNFVFLNFNSQETKNEDKCGIHVGAGPSTKINRPTQQQHLKGHWTSITSSPNFFQKKLRFLYHSKCLLG